MATHLSPQRCSETPASARHNPSTPAATAAAVVLSSAVPAAAGAVAAAAASHATAGDAAAALRTDIPVDTSAYLEETTYNSITQERYLIHSTYFLRIAFSAPSHLSLKGRAPALG